MGKEIPLFRFFEEAEKGGDPWLGAALWIRPGLCPRPSRARGGAGWGVLGAGKPGKARAGALGPILGEHCQY